MRIPFLLSLLMGLAILSFAGGTCAAKATICHKDLDTISINTNAWPAHKAHGDVWGSCDNYAKYSVVIIFRCGVAQSGGLTVTTVSASEDLPIAAPAIYRDDNCADANAALINSGFDLKNVTSGPVGSDFETEYLYSRKYLRYHRPK